ncbi:MAG: type II toxin-antitoxin system PemK/MazF family toxin [Planctomycetes bacterium]|nr:type II toxin-antitoxin system PemK/MazF family toxin [Planctomycetota bacterium]
MARPKRGEVWIVDLGYTAKRRPCVVLSVEFQGHEWALVTYVPRTTERRETRFEVDVATGLFDQDGVFNAQALGSTDHQKFSRKLGTLTSSQLSSVEDAVKRWLGIALAN